MACAATSSGATFQRKCGRIGKLRSMTRIAIAVRQPAPRRGSRSGSARSRATAGCRARRRRARRGRARGSSRRRRGRCHARRGQADRGVEPAVLVDGQGPHVRGVAEPLHMIERVRASGLGRAVDDHDPAAGAGHALHLAQHRQRIEKVVEGEARGHDREGRVRPRQRQHVALAPGHVRQAELGGVRPRAVQHRRRDVDAGRVAHDAREGRHDEPGAARDVEHRVLGAGAAALDDQPERRLVADARRGGEGRRLARELVEDLVPVLRGSACRHARLS